MLELTTSFAPYRLSLYRKEHVELRVKIKNAGQEKALVSFKMRLPQELSLDKSGFSFQHAEKLGEIAPGQTVEQRFEIHARPVAREGSAAIEIKATEHYNSYEFAIKEYRKKAELLIS